MKKLLLFLFISSVFSVSAQLDYSLTKSNSTYAELSGSTDVSAAAWNSMHTMSLPFQFTYFGNTYNNIYITFDGFFFSDTGDDYVFYGTDNYMPELALPTQSPISYQLTGSSPSRILKVQWKNIRESTADTAFDYYLNTQIWLYEGSNKIEYHFGNSSVTDPTFNSFYIGLIDYDNSPYLAIDSSAANPVLVRVLNAGLFDGIPAYPGSGLVYTLTPKVSSVKEVSKPYTFRAAYNSFSLKSETNCSVSVCDISGKMINASSLEHDGNGNYTLHGMSAGIYLVIINTGIAILTEKIIVR